MSYALNLIPMPAQETPKVRYTGQFLDGILDWLVPEMAAPRTVNLEGLSPPLAF